MRQPQMVLLLLLVGAIWTIVLPPQARANDDTYAALQKMLESGLSEEIVWAWLEGESETLARPSAEQMITLREAGASEDFLKRLLSITSRKSPEPRAAGVPSPSEAEPAAGSTALDSQAAAGDGVLVSFQLSYATSYDEGTRAWDIDEPWELYVYLDGIPVTYVPKDRTSLVSSFLSKGAGLEFQESLTPGKHMMWVAQERHTKKRGDRWTHAARFPAEPFEFELVAGRDAQLGLRFEEGWLGVSGDGPLTFKLIQGDRVQEAESVGGNPEEWRLLCDDAESSEGSTSKPRHCVRWQELWAPLEAPSRNSVRKALAEFEFRPVPKGS